MVGNINPNQYRPMTSPFQKLRILSSTPCRSTLALPGADESRNAPLRRIILHLRPNPFYKRLNFHAFSFLLTGVNNTLAQPTLLGAENNAHTEINRKGVNSTVLYPQAGFGCSASILPKCQTTWPFSSLTEMLR